MGGESHSLVRDSLGDDEESTTTAIINQARVRY